MIKKEIEGAALLSIYNELKDEIKAIRTDIQHLNIQQPQQSENNQELNSMLHIPADTRSAFPVISVQSPVSIQCCWQS